MDYFKTTTRKKHKGVFAKIVIFLLVCILAISVYGLFFYDGVFDETNELVIKITELEKELAAKDLKIAELEAKYASLEEQSGAYQSENVQ